MIDGFVVNLFNGSWKIVDFVLNDYLILRIVFKMRLLGRFVL